ncbi:GNAT family N-acetyltransferase [Sneathiella chinensis]|uniref:L-ornithine N(alpha)-acyltransferase n=1 Tax=Sneathiella chinensis TaxID=349750 RepID=A0ABQ5U1Q5_9PROT|nr:GNAT family N-acyltransferase [Sneathiella chinensis]GLQ06105.1 ornithine-acyl ACP N-acyltransferase [Sneathiella chinensis]
MSNASTSGLIIRLAENRQEIIKAQKLRYKVFYDGMGATPSAEIRAEERDFDAFDDYCDHLVVIDTGRSTVGNPCVVGTYRLLRRSVAEQNSGYYSASEFDLSRLAGYAGEHVELGRSCVDPEYRGKAIMQLLWRGIADYIADYDISLMFGCASFPGTDLTQMAAALTYLHQNHEAPGRWRPQAQPDRFVSMNVLADTQIDMRSAMREMPALIKGYLRVGGVIGEGAVIDYEFNTTDVCLLVETSNITDRYQKHFLDQHVTEANRLSA